jgi:hypothetical protein
VGSNPTLSASKNQCPGVFPRGLFLCLFYKRLTLAGTTKDILRIIQSIPSSKAEPFKIWLAQVGSERIAEIENPELAQKRIRDIYRSKGYSD